MHGKGAFSMDIYIKPKQKLQLVKRKVVYLQDIAEVYAPADMMQKLEHLPILQISKETQDTYLISVLDIIREITKVYPKATVSNVGEMDILVEYHPHEKNKNPFWIWAKILFVSAVLFCGAATTIMCFHSDTQLPLIFQNYYYIFFGENKDLPLLLALPYTLGLVVGILVFFNHFSKMALSKDPTPIEVEMHTYEQETVTSKIKELSKQQERKQKS